MNNFFDMIPETLPQELVETILTGKNVRVERIVSHGHASDEGSWYDQKEHELVLLLQGEAELEFIERSLRMKSGDYLLIKAGQKHRVKWTAPDQYSIWLAIFFI